MCEDSQLAVVKCNRFFFHKTNLQGIDLKKAQDQPSVIFHPAQGPMWGGQELHISILPTAQRVSLVSMCGSNVSHVSQGASSSMVLTPAVTVPMLSLPVGHSNAVVMSSIIVQCEGMEPLQAEGQYVYQGMWKWPPRTGVDIQSIDTGKSTSMLPTFISAMFIPKNFKMLEQCLRSS